MKPLQNRICSALLALCLLLSICGMLTACQPAEKYSLETENLIDACLNDVYDWDTFDVSKFNIDALTLFPLIIHERILQSDSLNALRQQSDALPALLNRCDHLLDSSLKYQPLTIPCEVARNQYTALYTLLLRDPFFSAQLTEADIAHLKELDAIFMQRYG